MTEQVTRTYDVRWEVYSPRPYDKLAATYSTIEEAVEQVRTILLDSAPIVYVQVLRKETEVTDG